MNMSTIFNKNNIRTFIKAAKENSISTLYHRSIQYIQDSIVYPRWFAKQQPSPEDLNIQRKTSFSYNPLISIVVPTYCTPVIFLHEMIQSVLQQTYNNWELCIADASPDNSDIREELRKFSNQDTRIKIHLLPKNLGISGNTNEALALATGEYVGLLDHDDVLAPDALYEIVVALNRDSSIDVLYTDEDKITNDSHTHYYPHFKPDYNRALLRSCNYICHFFVFKRAIYEQVGLFDSSYDGSQDYNYILRCTRIAQHVYHVPKILYHWRVHPGSVAGNPEQKAYCYDAAKRALQEDLSYHNIDGNVSFSDLLGFYHITYNISSRSSLLIIAFDPDFTCDAKYSNIEIRTVCVHSFEEAVTTVQHDSSQYCIFLNHGIKSMKEDSITATVSHLQHKENGAVTYKITHKSKILGLGLTYQDNTFKGCYQNTPCTDTGYYGRATTDQYVPFCSSVAFACRHFELTEYLLHNHIHDINDLAVSYSLYLYQNNLYTLGLADCVIPYPYRTLPRISMDELNKDVYALYEPSELYSIPPYHNN